MSDELIRRYLDEAEVFTRLDDAALTAVTAVTKRRDVARGQYLFREGEPGDYMFVIQGGVAEARKRNDVGVELMLRELGPGETGGLTSMTVDKKRSASVRAKTDLTLLVIDKRDFRTLLRDHESLVQSLLAHLSAKIRGKTNRLVSLISSTAQDGRQRIAMFDAKPYDRNSFDAHCLDHLAIDYFESRLGPSTVALAHGYGIVCAFVNDDLSETVIEQIASGGVRLIAMRCAGYNNVNLGAASAHGITVVRVPAYSPHAVAEHAMALILTLNRKTHRAFNRVREGNFSISGLTGFDLFGRVAGIVGLGKIGRCLAKILRGFGMEVLAHDAYVDEAFAELTGVRYVSLEELLQRADIISLHAPLTPETHHLIDRERLGRMKKGVMIINTSRGGLIDAKALIQGLKSGQVGAAGLDVYEEESGYFFEDRSDRVITDDLLARLMTFHNVLITSHQAFLTDRALSNIAETTIGNIDEFLAGKRGAELTHVVQPL